MSVFLTGKAGTGKTTFLKHLTETTPKRHVVLAPTGVAAINAGGSTIHSFFQLPLCPYLPDVKELITEYQMPEKYRSLRKDRIKIIRSLELLIIDEVSMVRADLMDAMDNVLRRYRRDERPFGGLQLLLIGDAQQLSPVVTESERPYISQVYSSPYFFCSKAFQKLPYITIELQKVHRQKDAEFLEILNAVRENRISDRLLAKLNSRVGVKPAGEDEPIRLTTHNRQAEEINTRKMDELPGEEFKFGADVEGDFPENNYPVDEVIRLKPGAQVMFVRNDPEGEYYNGKIGTVESIGKDGSVLVKDREGDFITVGPVKWENLQYALDSDTGEIRQNVAGVFTQIPLRSAWAITIHKSQGLTFDNVIIDAGSAFAFGQVYVALSRCRSLEGIMLESPIRLSTIYTDPDVSRFNATMDSVESVRERIEKEEYSYGFELLREIFDFRGAVKSHAWLRKIWKENLQKLYTEQYDQMVMLMGKLSDASEVALRFCRQITAIEAGLAVPGLAEAESKEAFLAQRLSKAAAYYRPLFEEMMVAFTEASLLDIDNKEVKANVKTAMDELLPIIDIKLQAMDMMLAGTYSPEAYNRMKSSCLTQDNTVATRRRRLRKLKPAEGEGESSVNEELRDRLMAWRQERFKKDNVPAYTILFQSTLLQIASTIPTTATQLMLIKGFGKAKYDKYGEEILAICSEFKK